MPKRHRTDDFSPDYLRQEIHLFPLPGRERHGGTHEVRHWKKMIGIHKTCLITRAPPRTPVSAANPSLSPEPQSQPRIPVSDWNPSIRLVFSVILSVAEGSKAHYRAQIKKVRSFGCAQDDAEGCQQQSKRA
jgi:hypothetical protein